jgi:hypothetical protein
VTVWDEVLIKACKVGEMDVSDRSDREDASLIHMVGLGLKFDNAPDCWVSDYGSWTA